MSDHNVVKLGLVFLLVLLVSGCGSKSEKLISDKLITKESEFGASTAQKGTFEEIKTYSASPVYPVSTTVCGNYDGVRLDEIKVEAGDKVKKGDLLVSIQQVTDEVLASQQKAIEESRQRYNQGIANYQSQIESLNASISESSGEQQQIYQIQKEKVQYQMEYYQTEEQKAIDESTQKLEQLKTLQGDINIYAPYDCVVDKIYAVPTGSELTTQRELVDIHDESQLLVMVSDGSELKYNMSVSVQAGPGKEQQTYEGKVISSDNVLDDAYQSGAAYIRLNENVSADDLKNISVKADVKKIDNVLLVKDYAVTSKKDKQYVSIIEGSKVMKRRVITGGSNGELVWIVKGLDEGQNVLIQ